MVTVWNTIFFGLSFTPSGNDTSQLSKIVANMILRTIEALHIQHINNQNHLSWGIMTHKNRPGHACRPIPKSK